MNWPRIHTWFNAVAIIVWLLLGIPTFMYWRESLIWIVLMSWYAIVVSHLSAFIAARAEVKADE